MNKRPDCLIGIDAGTTGLKCLAFDLQGRCLARSYREYPLFHPKPNRVEQDPEDWWRALTSTLREVLEKGEIEPGRVAGVSISSQGSTLVALGSDGKVIRPAISWLDKRAAEIPREPEWEDETLFGTTGLRYSPAWTGPMLHWLSIHEEQTIQKASKFLLVGDYLIYRLTGVIATDYSSASRTRMLDVRRQQWSEDIVASAGISLSQLPDIAGSGQIAGRISPESARLTGLCEGTPVMLGGFDQICAGLGAGTVTSDSLMVSLGTATMLVMTVFDPIVDPARRVTTSCHVIPQAWTLQAPILTSGVLLRWWRDHFFKGKTGDPYVEMDALAGSCPIGADGLLVFPHFAGGGAPWWDHDRRGAILGLSLTHTASHIIRGILEGIAMEIRANLETLESLGIQVRTVRIVGGGAASQLWRSIIGDVVGRPQIHMKEVEVGALGAAILAGVGAGIFENPAQGAAAMVNTGDISPFSADNHAEYNRIYARYEDYSRRLYGEAPWETASADAAADGETWQQTEAT